MIEQGSDISRIKRNGWRQGSLFVNATEQFLDKSERPLRNSFYYILISQNCDIVRDLHKEPYLEFLVATPVDKANGNFTKGKNSRILHLDINGKFLECIAYEKIYVDKKYFINISPDKTLLVEGNNLDVLNYWLSNRNSRIAYPDEFNRRLKESGIDKKIDSTMKKKGIKVKGVFIKLNIFDELEPSQKYVLIILFLVSRQSYLDDAVMKMVDACFEDITSLIKTLHGIELIEEESGVRSADDITVHEFQKYYKWDMDYISYSEEKGETMPGTNQI